MSFNQFRTNPGQAVSNFKGRTETPRAWPGTAVSTWMNGGLFGGETTPTWEVLQSFAPSQYTQTFTFDISSYKADYAAIRVSWSGYSTSGTSSNDSYVECQKLDGTTERYLNGNGIYGVGSYAMGSGPTTSYKAYKIRNMTVQYAWSQIGSYTFWGLADSSDQSNYGAGQAMFGQGYLGNSSAMAYSYTNNNSQAGNWDRLAITLTNSGGTPNNGRWDNNDSRISIWGLKAQRVAL